MKYDYSKVNYINNKTKIIVNCPEHGDFSIVPYHHKNGVGCSKCSNNFKINTLDFISKSIEVHGNKYDYSFVNYKNNKTKVRIICKEHGEFYQTPQIHIRRKYGCPKCNSSLGENAIRKILNELNISFVEQKRFDECKNKRKLPFDFYLPDYNICIEFDGRQHYEPIRGEKSYQSIIQNDNIKNDFCINNNIKLIRISHIENIKNNIERIKNDIDK